MLGKLTHISLVEVLHGAILISLKAFGLLKTGVNKIHLFSQELSIFSVGSLFFVSTIQSTCAALCIQIQLLSIFTKVYLLS